METNSDPQPTVTILSMQAQRAVAVGTVRISAPGLYATVAIGWDARYDVSSWSASDGPTPRVTVDGQTYTVYRDNDGTVSVWAGASQANQDVTDRVAAAFTIADSRFIARALADPDVLTGARQSMDEAQATVQDALTEQRAWAETVARLESAQCAALL